jgi:hypothetical protein
VKTEPEDENTLQCHVRELAQSRDFLGQPSPLMDFLTWLWTEFPEEMACSAVAAANLLPEKR